MTGAVEIFEKVRQLFTRYVPEIACIHFLQGMTWNPTWKATATKRSFVRWGPNRRKTARSFFRAFPYELHSWYQTMSELPLWMGKSFSFALFGILGSLLF